MSRFDRDPDRLADEEFDLLVIGGGINGTGVARDAARRGMRVALIEREDFGYGTTGRSTRLIHGGLRYLEHLELSLVRESLRERELLLRNAPHLVKPLAFLLPVYEGARAPPWKLRAGLLLYDLLSYDKSLPKRRYLSREQTLAEEPSLNPEGLRGAGVYYDAQVPDVERLCLENALDAGRNGAVVANHVEALEFRMRDGRVAGARARDRLRDREVEIRARITVNATGPWVAVLDVRHGEKRMRMTKGIHLVVPPAVRNAIVLFSPEDNRLFFAVPWLGRTLLGTTDTEYAGHPDDVHATREDVEYMIASSRRWLPGAPVAEIHSTYAGIRSLLNVEGVSEGEISRRHLLLDHERDEGIPGLVTIIGGKITPYRHVAEETVNLAAKRLGVSRRSDTRNAPLPGAYEDRERLLAEAADLAAEARVAAEAVEPLVDAYGSRAKDVLRRALGDRRLAMPLCPHGPVLAAEIAFAAEEEMAVTLADLLLRRTRAAWLPCEGRDAIDVALDVAAARLGWDDKQRADERDAYLAAIAERHRYRSDGDR